jgi:guanine deaminase
MAAAYEIGQLRGNALHPAQLWWLATQGSAKSLHMDHVIGSISQGYEADLVIVDLASTPAISQAVTRAQDIWQALFPTIMMGDDRAIASVWINGIEQNQAGD